MLQNYYFINIREGVRFYANKGYSKFNDYLNDDVCDIGIEITIFTAEHNEKIIRKYFNGQCYCETLI